MFELGSIALTLAIEGSMAHDGRLPIPLRGSLLAVELVLLGIAGALAAMPVVVGWRWSSKPFRAARGGLDLGAGARLCGELEAAGYVVVTYDTPAHGDSPGRRSSLPEFAAAVQGVADALGGVEVIVAHSFGAAAVSVALDRGMTVERAVYLAPASDIVYFPRFFGRLTGFTEEVMEEMKRRIESRFGFSWPAMDAVTRRPPIDGELLVVHDVDDPEVPCLHSRRLVAAVDRARLVTTHGLGHRRLLRDERWWRRWRRFWLHLRIPRSDRPVARAVRPEARPGDPLSRSQNL